MVVVSTQAEQIERFESTGWDKFRGGPENSLFSDARRGEGKACRFVIRNEGSLAEVRERAKEVFRELKKIALQRDERHSV